MRGTDSAVVATELTGRKAMAALDKRSTGVGRKPTLLVVDASVGFTDPNYALGSSFDSKA